MGFPPSGMRVGAILDPSEAPTTTPTSEKTPARKPVLAPRNTETMTKRAINRSRTPRPAKSIYRFYIVGTLRLLAFACQHASAFQASLSAFCRSGLAHQ